MNTGSQNLYYCLWEAARLAVDNVRVCSLLSEKLLSVVSSMNALAIDRGNSGDKVFPINC